ncbi:hypothetical protein [Acetobacterium sp.]|uniref:hypothetical protein n=1 Tax=Acetobacterium sp. TaxID=1872094 RepID=UPI002F42FEC0
MGEILLGNGVVAVDSVPIGLTRGGSIFTVEREIRDIEADGDRGPVKGRQVIDTEIAKLEINALELFTAVEMLKHYPATSLTSGVSTDTWRSNLTIALTDYHTVTWTGATKTGKAILVTLENAINIGNLEMTFEDKNEVIPLLEYTATYLSSTRNTPPWSVEFAKGDSYDVAITVTTNGTVAIPDAVLSLYGLEAVADVNGIATLENIPEGMHTFSVNAAGYQTYFGAIEVDGANFADTITMVEIA